MEFKEDMIILAPANMHTGIYNEILSQKGDCINIEVYAMNSFIKRFFKGLQKEELEVLYQYKDALSALDKENSFYESRDSFDFLKACFDFVKMIKTYNYNVERLPVQSAKQKDLKEAINLIYPVSINEDQITSFIDETYDFNNIYILRKEYADLDFFWIDFLLKNGAHWLENDIECKKHYWTCSNIKKQAELVAKTIIEKGYDAKDVFVAANEEVDFQMIAHFFDFYQIPYTFLQNDTVSNLQAQYISILNWAVLKTRKTLIALIKTCYPKEEAVLKYLQLFPEDTPLTMEYKENSLIEENEYASYQRIQNAYNQFTEKHEDLMNLYYPDIETSLKILSDVHKYLTKEDYKIASCIYDSVRESLPYINSEEDVYLLMEDINHMKSISGPMEYKGVLIGKRKDITPLRKIVFLLSAHNKQFPSLQLKTGLFDETYMKCTDLPSLQDRLNRQREQIFTCLSQCEELYVLYPQSNFEGKSYISALEMDTFMNTKATFIPVEDYSVFESPAFDLGKEFASSLFFKDNAFVGSVSRLESYTRCPLQHFIRYGLHLQEFKQWEDVRVRGTILHHILEVLSSTYKKDYASVSKEEIEPIVNKEFEFAKVIFPNKKAWLEATKLEYISKISLILEQLQYFEENWHMHTEDREYKYTLNWEGAECSITLYGYIDRVDVSNTSFCVFDYKTSDKDLKIDDFESGVSLQLATYTIAYEEYSKLLPVGQFYISLRTTPIKQEAYTGNYRKKIPGAEKIIVSKEAFTHSKKLKGWALQDMSTYCDEKSILSTATNTPSFPEMKEKWKYIIEDIISELKEGDIKPHYTEGACDYCAYRPICRNARQEIQKKSRLAKEED